MRFTEAKLSLAGRSALRRDWKIATESLDSISLVGARTPAHVLDIFVAKKRNFMIMYDAFRGIDYTRFH